MKVVCGPSDSYGCVYLPSCLVKTAVTCYGTLGYECIRSELRTQELLLCYGLTLLRPERTYPRRFQNTHRNSHIHLAATGCADFAAS